MNKIVTLALLTFVTYTTESFSNRPMYPILRNGTQVDTGLADLKKLGLKEGDVCKLSEIQVKGKKVRVINCVRNKKIVKQFKNVGMQESAITGTPGNLMYENYIGYVKTAASTPGMLGSGKRVDFCDGECKRKK